MSRMGKSGHDDSLLSSMAARLRKVEEELEVRSKELDVKDRELHDLRVQVGDQVGGRTTGGEGAKDKIIAHLRKECQKAFKQIQEMEEFLADYGMIWVGDSESPDLKEIPEEEEEKPVVSPGLWSQGESVADTTPKFNLIIENIHELNILAGDGVGTIGKGPDGIARVIHPDPVPLTLYSNGLFLFQGPFRPYADPQTKQMVTDFEEGYFPSELQRVYPKGMPIKVTDLREKRFVDQRVSFPGRGSSLTEAGKELAAIRGLDPGEQGTKDVATAPPHQLQAQSSSSVERFLNKLPANVIRDGKIIDIRSSVGTLIGNSPSEPSSVKVEIVETDVVKQIQAGEGTSGQVATLRVKLEGGSKTLIVKLQYTDTIGDLREFINRHKTGNFEIRTTFPNRKYDRLSETLEGAGLVPSATLHIRDI